MDAIDQLEPKKTLSQRAMMAGLLSAVAGILISLVFYITGWDMDSLTNPTLSWINRILLIGTTYYFIHAAVKSFRDEDLGGFVSVGQGIGLGTLAGVVSGIVSSIWFYIFTQFIATEMLDRIKTVAMEKMQEQGQSAEQADKAMEMMSFFFSPVFFLIVMILSSIFFGFLCGLAAGLILKKEKPYM